MRGVVVIENLMHEQELIERLKAGDPKAIDEIVNSFKGPLFALILRMVSNHSAAEDIFQETWLRVIRNVQSFRGDSKLSTWLFQIAVNLCRDAIRKKKRWTHVSIDDYADSLSCDPGFDGLSMIKAQQIRKMVDSIPVKMREVVVLRYYHDLNDKEISEIVGCPVGTVKSRFFHASKILRKKWEHLNRELTIQEKSYETI